MVVSSSECAGESRLRSEGEVLGEEEVWELGGQGMSGPWGSLIHPGDGRGGAGGKEGPEPRQPGLPVRTDGCPEQMGAAGPGC